MKQFLVFLLMLLCVVLILPTQSQAGGPIAAWMEWQAARNYDHAAMVNARTAMRYGVPVYDVPMMVTSPPAVRSYRTSSPWYSTPVYAMPFATVSEVTVPVASYVVSDVVVSQTQWTPVTTVMTSNVVPRACTQAGRAVAPAPCAQAAPAPCARAAPVPPPPVPIPE